MQSLLMGEILIFSMREMENDFLVFMKEERMMLDMPYFKRI